MPPTDFGLPFQIGIASRTPSVPLAEVVKATTAINLQISRDFAPIWGVSASVVAISNPDAIDPGIWPIFVQDDISADELDGRFVRYTHAQRYSPDLFDPAYHWMKDRGFTDGRNSHDTLVVS